MAQRREAMRHRLLSILWGWSMAHSLCNLCSHGWSFAVKCTLLQYFLQLALWSTSTKGRTASQSRLGMRV